MAALAVKSSLSCAQRAVALLAHLRLRRSGRTIALAIVAATSLSCSDALLGNGRARVVVEPRFTQRDAAIFRSLETFNLGVTTVRVVVTRPNSSAVLAERTVTVDADADDITVTLDVVISGVEELLTARMEMRSGEVLIFSGSVNVVARAGAGSGSVAPLLVPVWVGPGANATRIEILPRNLTIPVGGTVAFSATAYDAAGLPILDPDYLARWQWRVDNTALGSIPLAGGSFTGAGTAGVVRVMVFTPNLLRDTVFVTLVTQQPQPPTPATLSFARRLEVLTTGATSTIPVTVRDAAGAPLPAATLAYTSRAAAVAGVNASGVISGVAPGQAIVAASAVGFPAVADSALVVVANPGAPILISDIDRFDYAPGTTFTVSVFLDFRTATTRLGSTTMDVEWDPAQLVYASHANGASGVIPTVNATLASTGRLTLAMADVLGFGGRVELLRVTFRTATTPSVGQLRLIARELTASDFTNLLGTTVQVTHPIRVQ